MSYRSPKHRTTAPPAPSVGAGIVAGALPVDRPAAGAGDHRRVMDGLVGAGVDQERAPPREVRRLGLHLLVEGRAGDPPGPAGMGAQTAQIVGDPGDHLQVKVETDDLVHDRIGHRVPGDQPSDLGELPSDLVASWFVHGRAAAAVQGGAPRPWCRARR